MRTHDTLAQMVELRALDALEDHELKEFDAHLGECEICQLQLAEARSIAAALVPDSAAPDHMWDRIVADLQPEATVTQLRKRSRPLVIMTSIAAALAIALGGVLLAEIGPTGEESVVAAAERAAQASDSMVVDLVVEDVTVAEIILTSEGLGFVLPTDDLADLDDSRTYQLWVINENERVVSGGVLGASPMASTFTWADGVSGFALTREVAGGVEVSAGDVVAVVTDI